MSLLVTKNLTKTYQMGGVSVHALRGVSITIEAGEFVGIIGSSGSGKSTLLRLLGLIDSASEGSIEIDGVSTETFSDSQKTQFRLTQMGYIFQEYALLPELTAAENVLLPTKMITGTMRNHYESARDLFHKIDLYDRMDHLPSELSGGQQQRVAIARALINSPKILFADEPTANLDSVSSQKVMETFKQFNQEFGQTIVAVSHDPEHQEYFDRLIVLEDGKLKDTGK